MVQFCPPKYALFYSINEYSKQMCFCPSPTCNLFGDWVISTIPSLDTCSIFWGHSDVLRVDLRGTVGLCHVIWLPRAAQAGGAALSLQATRAPVPSAGRAASALTGLCTSGGSRRAWRGANCRLPRRPCRSLSATVWQLGLHSP